VLARLDAEPEEIELRAGWQRSHLGDEAMLRNGSFVFVVAREAAGL
jgi:hypothetical protein